ncbi:MAG: hypothetical protein K2P71_00225 [Lachnospiraceae bacterium]|jgi:hypothetical protein|nr:hypothetical protein [Lachnospiraceae bacterium]
MVRKNKSPQKAAMREMMRRYLKDNDMRDPDQPKRDSFDLGDFLRSTLTGDLMGGSAWRFMEWIRPLGR